MRVAVVGAGIAGLGAARTLQRAAHEVTVFEKGADVGGRLVSKHLQGFIFDAGATSIAPFGQGLESVILNDLPSDDLVKIERPVMAHDGWRVQSAGLHGSKTPRYCYGSGINKLAELLSEGLDVRLNCEVLEVSPRHSESYEVLGEEFDAVVIAVPTPLAEPLLAAAKESRRFSNVRYRSCLSVLLGFDEALDAPYHALVGPDQTMPLAWLSIENLKCPTHAPEGKTALVAQLSAEYSRRRFATDDDLILEETLGDVSRLLGKRFAVPTLSHIERFWYSHPETTATFESVNSSMSRLVIAGDALLGGRTELAYETGVRAARILLGKK